jgi:hypothetical protein
MTLKKQLYLFGADFDNIDLAKVCGLGFVFFGKDHRILSFDLE